MFRLTLCREPEWFLAGFVSNPVEGVLDDLNLNQSVEDKLPAGNIEQRKANDHGYDALARQEEHT